MEASAEVLEGDRAKVTVTIDADTVTARIKKQYRDFAGQYRIPGFRKGKAPRQVIDNYLGKQAVVATVTDAIVNETCMQAVDQTGLYPLGQPDFEGDLGLVEEGKAYTYAFEVGVKPTPALSNYDNVEITMPSAEVTDDEINAEIEAMLYHYQEVTDAADDAVIADDNYANLKIAATDDEGKDIESISTDDRQYGVASGLFPATFDDELKGMKKGDKKQFAIDVPEEPTVMTASLVGKTKKINFDVEVLQVKVRNMPELTDEFAKEKLGMDSAAEVREELSNLLANQKNAYIPRLKEERALAALAERLEGEVPAALAEQQEGALLQNFFGQLQQQGITFDVYLQSQGLSSQQFRDDVKKQAEDLTKQDLALDAWAAHAGMTATDEDIKAEFEKSGAEDPEALQKEWAENGQLFLVRQGILRQKAAADVTDNAVVTEEAAGDKKKPAKKAAAKKSTAKKSASKDEAKDEAAAEKKPAKKPAAKKSTAKKAAEKDEAAAEKKPAKKAAAKKTTAKKAADDKAE